MSTHNPLFLPVVSLVAWSMVMWFWMYLTRLPAIFKAKLRLDPMAPHGEQMRTLPPQVRWKADNYNHLMEQPTIFYAVTIVLALMGQGDGANYFFAWAYVLLRVAHSLVVALGNVIELRFVLFVLSSFALMGLIVNALRVLLVYN